jgi:hypothetical protein
LFANAELSVSSKIFKQGSTQNNVYMRGLAASLILPTVVVEEKHFITLAPGTVGLANLRATCDGNPQSRTSINEYFNDDLQSGKVSLLWQWWSSRLLYFLSGH